MALLDQKVALVSGGAQGLGAAFVQTLSEHGARVLTFDVRSDVTKVAAEIQSATKNEVVGLAADVSSRQDVEHVVSSAIDRFGQLDILINDAAVWRETPLHATWDQTLEDWDAVMDTNLKGVLMLTRTAVPHLKTNGGDIVNVSANCVLPARSAGSHRETEDLYAASMWALNGFTDAWSKYLAKDSIRVNGLCVGPTETPMLQARRDAGITVSPSPLSPQQIAKQLIDLLKDGRTGENIGSWSDMPVTLPERATANRRISG